MAEGFDPNRSQVGEDKLAAFLQAEVSEEISSVPGIGPRAKELLAKEVEGDQAITTTYQLIGKFLTLKGQGMTPAEHCNAMWHWLKLRGVSSHRAGIVLCLAEKVNLFMPGVWVPPTSEVADEKADS
mmetsp:Transcript_10588/g.15872  ORF Transcript_10588/g.15872 Transcript_10588/m.15872 type:complete len:127 (+) Transcript_10588:83-463(+)